VIIAPLPSPDKSAGPMRAEISKTCQSNEHGPSLAPVPSTTNYCADFCTNRSGDSSRDYRVLLRFQERVDRADLGANVSKPTKRNSACLLRWGSRAASGCHNCDMTRRTTAILLFQNASQTVPFKSSPSFLVGQ